jgi:hypothetical protein
LLLMRSQQKLLFSFPVSSFPVSKFQSFEARDPFLVKQVRSTWFLLQCVPRKVTLWRMRTLAFQELNRSGTTQWDRYAQQEYQRLASEEEEASTTTASAGGGSLGAGGVLNDDGDDFMGRLLNG